MRVSCFSTGASSAVATKLAISQIDRIIYIHIEDQHPDSMRFVRECEDWFGKEIEILRSPYLTVEAACMNSRFINSPRGASCTKILKKRVRKQWELENDLHDITYVWGIDYDEKHRIDNILKAMPLQNHAFPLIENRVNKTIAHQHLFASGIKRPAMYDMGYNNNNCIGCVKGGKGYWNKIRIDFPQVFANRMEMEKNIGASCINGTFLQDLLPDEGYTPNPVIEDCGLFCEMMAM